MGKEQIIPTKSLIESLFSPSLSRYQKRDLSFRSPILNERMQRHSEFLAENKKRNFDQGQNPAFKIPLLLQMVGVVLIVRENSLYAQKCEFFNSFKIGCEKLRKILRKG